MSAIRLGSRGDQPALDQARRTIGLLAPFAEPRRIEIATPAAPLVEALRDGSIDAAVVGVEDLPAVLADGVRLAATPMRGPTGDAFISEIVRRFDDLPRGARVLTACSRRLAMLSNRRADLHVERVQADASSLLDALHAKSVDGIVVAESEMVRHVSFPAAIEVLDEIWMLPSVGQGAAGLLCRSADMATYRLLDAISHEETWRRVTAERALRATLDCGPLPLGATSHIRDGVLTLRGMLLSTDGRRAITATHRGPAAYPLAVGQELAAMLIDEGARELSAL